MSAGRTVVAIRSDFGLASLGGRSGPAQTRPPGINIITRAPRELARVLSWLTQASRDGTHLQIVVVRASDPQLLSRDESLEYEHPGSVPLNLTALTGHAERPIRRYPSRVALIVAAIGGGCYALTVSDQPNRHRA
jgi:hypothetical protein